MSRQNLPAIFNELFDELTPFRGVFAPFRESASVPMNSGVSLYEDEGHVVVEAAVPGVKPEDIEVTFDRGGVSIEGKKREEQSAAKYHLRASSSHSYWVPLPSGKVDEQAKPEALCKNGIITISFAKSRSAKPLKISVKEG